MTDENEALPALQPDAPAPETPGMPLGAKRLVLLGCLGVLGGVLVGRFLFAGLVLAAAGITAVSIALSYRTAKPWFSPLSWVVGVAGVLWTAVTAAYGWSISAGNAPSAGSAYSSVLLNAGTLALGLMGAGVLAAVVLRTLRRSRKVLP